MCIYFYADSSTMCPEMILQKTNVMYTILHVDICVWTFLLGIMFLGITPGMEGSNLTS